MASGRNQKIDPETAAATYGPTMTYLTRTQPGWITALVWLAAVFLVIGAVSSILMCVHLIAIEPRKPNIILAAGFAVGIVVGMALLIPMLVYRAVKGLPYVFEHKFVRAGSIRLLPVWGAYFIVFFISVPLLLDEYGGQRMPDWLEEYGRLLVDFHGLLRWHV